jgi:hypothetical protein
MTRLNLYGHVHKGLRARLAASATLIAGTDFCRADEARACANALRRTLGFLDEHAAHEDAHVMPAIARLDPDLAERLATDHETLDAVQRQIERLLDEMDAANAAEREVLGLHLHELTWKLVAGHAVHMAVEEGAATRTLWAHLGDGELLAIKGKILAAIPPERMAEWFELKLPALNFSERAAMLRELSAAMPPHVFAALTGRARTALGETAWASAEFAAGIAGRPARELQLAS